MSGEFFNIGDEAILAGNFRPKYLQFAIVTVKNATPDVDYGCVYEVEIVRLRRPRNNGRFFPGATAIRVPPHWLTKRERF